MRKEHVASFPSRLPRGHGGRFHLTRPLGPIRRAVRVRGGDEMDDWDWTALDLGTLTLSTSLKRYRRYQQQTKRRPTDDIV